MFALELSEEFAPIPAKGSIKPKARGKLPPSPYGGGNTMKRTKHPFPNMYIEAHAGSSVIVGGSGHTSASGGAGPVDQLEADLLRLFRSLPLREQVGIMNNLYRYESMRRDQRKQIKITPTCKGRGKKTACCGADS